MTTDTKSATPDAAGSGGAPPRPKRQGKREPWRCLYCDEELLVKDNCRKPDCLEKYEAARRRMGIGGGL